jgi:hypothetical protein
LIDTTKHFAILFQKGARVQNSEIFGTHLKCEIVKQDKCPKYAGFEISGRPLAIGDKIRIHQNKLVPGLLHFVT